MQTQNETLSKLINLAVFNQLGRDFCDHTNTFASSDVDYPPPPIGDGGYIRPGGFCVYEVNIALMYVQKYRNAGAPFIKWCELHQPDELMVSCQGFLRCLSSADVKKYELSYRVLDLAIDNDPGVAGNLLKYFQNHPYTAVIPYSVLKLHRDPNRNNQAIKSIGIDAQAQDWPLEEGYYLDSPNCYYYFNFVCAHFIYRFYRAPEGDAYAPYPISLSARVVVQDANEDPVKSKFVADTLRWITLKPHDDESKGQHVLIEEEGGKKTIEGGLGGKYNGQPLSILFKGSQLRSQREVDRLTAARKPATVELTHYDRIHAGLLNNQRHLARLTAKLAELIALARNGGGLSLNEARINAERTPLGAEFLEREKQENLALIGSDQWEMPLTYDFQDRFDSKEEFSEALRSAQTIARAAYSFRALKRLSIAHNQPLSEAVLERGKLFEQRYQALIAMVTKEHADQLAVDMAQCAGQLDVLAFARVTTMIWDSAKKFLFSICRSKDAPPSLLTLIGTPSNGRNPFYEEYNQYKVYLQLPSGAADIKDQIGHAQNPAFNNLINALALKTAAELSPDATLELKKRVAKLYEQALTWYRESHDGLPLSVAINRDLAVFVQNKARAIDIVKNKSYPQQIGYGKPSYSPEKVNGVPQRDCNLTVEEWLEMNSRHYDFINPLTGKQPFSYNCQAGVVAYELFLRGYEVVARPNMKNNHNLLPDLSLHPNLIWHNPITKTAPDIRPLNSFGQLEKLCYYGERYNFVFTAISTDSDTLGKRHAHVVAVERTDNGVVITDPQFGCVYSIRDYYNWLRSENFKITGLAFYRIDDCDIFGDYACYIVRAPSKDPVIDAVMEDDSSDEFENIQKLAEKLLQNKEMWFNCGDACY